MKNPSATQCAGGGIVFLLGAALAVRVRPLLLFAGRAPVPCWNISPSATWPESEQHLRGCEASLPPGHLLVWRSRPARVEVQRLLESAPAGTNSLRDEARTGRRKPAIEARGGGVTVAPGIRGAVGALSFPEGNRFLGRWVALIVPPLPPGASKDVYHWALRKPSTTNRRLARAVATQWGTDHTEAHGTPGLWRQILERVWPPMFDEPFRPIPLRIPDFSSWPPARARVGDGRTVRRDGRRLSSFGGLHGVTGDTLKRGGGRRVVGARLVRALGPDAAARLPGRNRAGRSGVARGWDVMPRAWCSRLRVDEGGGRVRTALGRPARTVDEQLQIGSCRPRKSEGFPPRR